MGTFKAVRVEKVSIPETLEAQRDVEQEEPNLRSIRDRTDDKETKTTTIRLIKEIENNMKPVPVPLVGMIEERTAEDPRTKSEDPKEKSAEVPVTIPAADK